MQLFIIVLSQCHWIQ